MISNTIVLPNGIELKNRIVKAAMSEALADKTNQPNTDHIALYERWAEGGAGVLISGNVMIDRSQLGEPGNIVLDNKTDRNALISWAKAGTYNDTKFLLQINHPGKQAPKSMSKKPVAPSTIKLSKEFSALFNEPRELTTDEVRELIEKFVLAGKIAEETGFSGVEIHAAHGYLINQFLSPADNKRKDEYGGTLKNRMRFMVEVFQGIRKITSPKFIIGLKLNSSDFTEDGFSEKDSLKVIVQMAELGIDFIEISGGNYEKAKVMDVGQGVFFLDFAKKAQNSVDIPIMLTGGLTSKQGIEDVIHKEGISLVGLGRSLIMNPNIPNQLISDAFQSVQLPRLSTGIKTLDKKVGGAIGIAYYEQQIEKLVAGKQAKYTTNAWGPLLHTVFRHGLHSITGKRR
ncbi:NADH:flavin oxidoreductase/NADH oxidase family protein [Enterococcus sp. DIV1298c]|uniref:NADH:flavin oxidoreductase/NADH oxidase family protein n=1 Tax=Enterococcus sp. DIV1298c TaxID=2815328 RepID=UPI001A92A22C|nr:NADH:flavin oxidoreductase/NADH oxidase family protein [Enterococcus sp. DIV1298c]MBO0462236.1 NADH:flavin oxidoreductase/NADH oxidase family protein [Enterococcus sp. DIV1298c]